MYIDNIIISNFRNFEFTDIKTKKTNIIYGRNASGKTNTIEAIYTLINGHSFKNKNLPLQKNSQKKTILSATLNNNNIYIEIFKGKKTIKLNTKPTTTIHLKKTFSSILYSIESFISFKDKKYIFSLLDRNSFINNQEIVDMILEYNKLLKLKKTAVNSPNNDKNLLNILHNKILSLMREISNNRQQSSLNINSKINNILKNFTDKKAKIIYETANYKKDVLEYEIQNRKIITSLNKDKFTILFDDKDIFTYASIGEKKIVLLSLILSIVENYNKTIKPILLIDDLEGDLDDDAKKTALKILKEFPNQLFLTTLGEYLYNGANIIRL